MAFLRTGNSNSNTQLLSSRGLFDFSHLESGVQSHLKNVYSTLCIGALAAAGGAYIHLQTGAGHWQFLTMIASLALMMWLAATKHAKEDVAKRVSIFTGFCFTSGISLGPLMDYVVRVDPTIITTSLAGTAVVFIGFTMASLLTKNRTFLYLGGFLATALMWMTFAGFLNIFFRSQVIFDIYPYAVLLIFSGFVLYDTQLIVEKRRRGDEDFVWHSVDLFLDAINIFRALMIILAKKEDNKKRRRD